jgi:hypothetical protein
MTWSHLLFAHWPVPGSVLRSAVPSRFVIEEFDGSAWIAVVPFLMTGIRLRGMPGIPGFSRTLELNVRTYVRYGPDPGVYFFSLDAEMWAAVVGARLTYHLPYFHAQMRLSPDGDVVHYESRRRHRGAPAANFEARYQPLGDPYLSRPGSLEHWLTERYALFTTDQRGRVIRGDIHHAQWPLQRAEAELELNTMTAPLGVEIPKTQPLLHYARRLEVIVWPPKRM